MSDSTVPPVEPVPPNPSPPPPAPAPAPAPAPPASGLVANAPSDRENELSAELELERTSHARTADEKRDRELRIMQLEDELRALKQVVPPDSKKIRRGALGVTLLREED